MLWLVIALLSFLGFAIVAISDRYFLTGPLRSPALYAAIGGILTILSFAVLPLDWFVPNLREFVLDFAAGALFVFGLWLYFVALKHGEASRVVPLSSAFVPLFTLLFAQHLLSEKLSSGQLVGFLFLVTGGVIISVGAAQKNRAYKTHKTNRLIDLAGNNWAVAGFTIGASFLFALHFTLLKQAYADQPFIGALVWSSAGKVLAGLFLLLILHLKQSLPNRFKPASHPKHVALYFSTRAVGAASGIGQNYAISLAPVSVVNALQGFQHLFLFLLIYLIGKKIPKLYENLTRRELLNKLLAVLMLSLGLWLIYPQNKDEKKFEYGLTFSQSFAEYGLNTEWRKVYDDILNELPVSWIRIPVYWSQVQPEQDVWDLEGIDYQIRKAAEKNIKIILAVGRKLPRWPECHIPAWAQNLSQEQQKEYTLNYLEQVVNLYDNNEAVRAWQVENEPLFPFGLCPEADRNFLQREVDLVGSLSQKPIIITDSGEFSWWHTEANLGDILGSTMYRRVFHKRWGEIEYPIPSIFFRGKAALTKITTGKFNQPIFNVELQAEPWGRLPLIELPVEEQLEIMNSQQLLANVDYAQRAGFSPILFWGVEWWWWMKNVHNDASLWNTAKNILRQEQRIKK